MIMNSIFVPALRIRGELLQFGTGAGETSVIK